MVINCVIKLDNNDGRIFYSGQTISGSKIKFQLQFHYCSRVDFFFTGTVELNLNEKSNLIGTMTFIALMFNKLCFCFAGLCLFIQGFAECRWKFFKGFLVYTFIDQLTN